MTGKAEHLVAELLAIQQKHKTFFNKNNQDIFSCVYVKWSEPVTLHIITDILPDEIRADIQSITFKD